MTFALYEHSHGASATGSSRQISIVLHSDEQNQEDLARALAAHLRDKPAASRVIVFGFESNSEFIIELMDTSSAFMSRLENAWGGGAVQKCQGVVLLRDGRNYAIVSGSKNKQIDNAKLEAETAAEKVAQEIFISGQCIQHAPHGVHFEKTSGAHSQAFIRASNALVRSADTLTLAFWLQPFFSQPASRILVDTSAIASLAYAAGAMSVAIGVRERLPVIESFQSYDGLSAEDLTAVDNTLFLISASTSGNLAREAFSKRVARDRLMTLFLLAREQLDQDALCRLGKSANNPQGLPFIDSWKADECQLCTGGSAAIRIGGDLFLTSLPSTTEIGLVKTHVPDGQRALITKFSGLGVFRVNRRIGDVVSEFSVDITPILTVGDGAKTVEILNFHETWQQMLRRHVPANLSHVVAPTYPASENLQSSVENFAYRFLDRETVVAARAADLAETREHRNGAAIVVTPCIDDAVQMMGISRDLRSVVPGGNVTYFAPFIRAKKEGDAKAIRTNLTYGDRGPGTHSLYSLFDLYLPDDRIRNPWTLEGAYLRQLSEWLEEQGSDIPPCLLTRTTTLLRATADGMIDNLFWPDAAGQPLQIRSNFVLLPTNDGTKPLTQADVYTVVACALNELRQQTQGDSLRCSEYARRVISPQNFVRFNDGVIQASILRACSGDELNFVATDNDAFSGHMRNIIISMINETGEALTEVMLAMAIGHLRLIKADESQVLNCVIDKKASMPAMVVLIAEAMKAGVVGNLPKT